MAAVRTQHALSTGVVEILEGEVAARTLTYVTATHFGVGAYYGEVCWLKSVSFVYLFIYLFICLFIYLFAMISLRPSAA